MKFKKFLAATLALALAGSMTACGEVATLESTSTTAAAGDGDSDSVETTSMVVEDIDLSDIEYESSEETLARLKELYGEETIQLTVYSQLANYSGKLTGWFAEVLKQKFNCEITIIPETDGTFDTRMESGNLGDIVIFGSNGSNYQRAAKEGMLFDWNEDDLLSEWGSYIQQSMPYALQNNINLNESVGAGSVLYGFGHNVATSTEDHEAFFYTMDIRWDLYSALGYPTLATIDDLFDCFVSMKEICPTDENGKETYAMSLWPDWDGNMVMYVKAFATCYWGYDEMGFGLYDVETGEYHDALEENGPYLTALKFFNKCYQAGLIDPNSMTQTYSEMSEKVSAGGVFFSIFDYAGSQLYNSEEHLDEGTAMYPVVPDDASPLCYGMNVLGGNRLWTIGANTEYPELCMAIINWLCTPEGYMTYWYGPEDLCWYYDDEGNTYFTEFGATCNSDKKGTTMPDEWGGGTFDDGSFQANNTTWSKDASNPDSNGETYNYADWKSNRGDTSYSILQDWRDTMGVYDVQEYMNTTNYKVSLATSYTESDKSDELKIIWEQVKNCIVNYSWQAIYASSDEEYESIVAEMISKCAEYDPNGECLAWCENEAAIRCALEDEIR